MPKIQNMSGLISIVSAKRAAEMVAAKEAVLLDEPDMDEDTPLDTRRNIKLKKVSKLTRGELNAQAEADQSEVGLKGAKKPAKKNVANLEESKKKAAEATVTEDDESATPEEAMAKVEAEAKK